MTHMPPRYAFNLTPDRFDTHVMSVFEDTAQSRFNRDRLLADVQGGRYDDMLPRSLGGLERLSDEANVKAAQNVIDFHFEPIVLATMPVPQARDYFHALERVMTLKSTAPLDEGGPLWIDCLHHACVFSALFQIGTHLIRQRGYRRTVLLHQGQRPEPRLAVIANVLQKYHGMRPDYIRLTGNWFFTLSQLVTPDTAIFYLADMPIEVSSRKAPRERQPTLLQLDVAPDFAVRLETLSASATLAKRLGATHLVLDFPGSGQIAIRAYDPAAPMRCPFEEWVFWPAVAPLKQAG
ncbi:hypothetical protein T281_08415 [Rhodomicrobium udaipurense JA643]|uniref:Uncharacterized protein n=1 Tax=Rhodomicrobium udaipurense TaxID=1202716 RepID=A0A8I1GHY8_9HYPH|nr:hypothetical protein [Rhodomicrobium udaipurense]KAI94900.1 hypothetical protein T281_08415 [Rhodomicrobium udaipurense JA643]MBJ7543875.1 hypothetical protein [Rhodomicrobium udaipurense]